MRDCLKVRSSPALTQTAHRVPPADELGRSLALGLQAGFPKIDCICISSAASIDGVGVSQPCLIAELSPCLWLPAEAARTGPLSLFVALPDLQALPGLQQEHAEVSNGWVVAARGSVALDTSDDLEVTGILPRAAHSVVQAGRAYSARQWLP